MTQGKNPPPVPRSLSSYFKHLLNIRRGLQNLLAACRHHPSVVLPTLRNYIAAFVKSPTAASPVEVQLEIARVCNLRCAMCHLTTNPAVPSKQAFLGLADFCLLLDHSAPLRHLAFIGLGEAVLHRDFSAMLQELNRRNIDYTLISNGQLFTESVAEVFFRQGPHTLLISMESGKPEMYERLRKGGRFDTLTRNLRILSAAQRSFSPGTQLGISSVILTEAIQDIQHLTSIIDVAKSCGISFINFANVASPREIGMMDYYLDTEKNVFLKSQIGTLTAYARKQGVNIRLPQTQTTPCACRLPWISPYVTAQGHVLPCCALIELGAYDDMVARYSLGNVLQEPLAKVWNNAKAIAFRKAMTSDHPPECCASCAYYWGIL